MDDFFMADPDAPKLSQKKRKRMQAAANKASTTTTSRINSNRRGDDNDDDADSDAGGNPAETIDDMDLVGDRNNAAAGGSNGDDDDDDDDNDARETPAQKRLRLAKRYLAKVRQEETGTHAADIGEVDAAELDREIIASRLVNDALESSGRLFTAVAEGYARRWKEILGGDEEAVKARVRVFKHGQTLHALAVTAVAVVAGGSSEATTGPVLSAKDRKIRKPVWVYSVSKDASIVKWDFWTGKRVHHIPGGLKPTRKLTAAYGKKLPAAHVGHNDHILAVAASADGQFVATGGRDKSIHIWSVATNKLLTTFTQHRDAVTGLTFRKVSGSNTLYSCSQDRTIKLWNVDEMSYVETLYGHQDHVTAIDTLTRERCITAGARDRTLRMWKIIDESQLIFRGGGGGGSNSGGETAGQDLVVMDGLRKDAKVDKAQSQAGGSLDAVALLDEEHFVSGSDTGAISLWNVNRKKPLFTKLRAHGVASRTMTPILTFAEGGGGGGGGETTTTTTTTTTADAVVVVSEAEMEGRCGGITALAAVKYTDMFASGSADGFLRLWKVDAGKKRFTMIACIPMPGFINSLAFFEAPSVPAVIPKQKTTDITTTTTDTNASATPKTPTTTSAAARLASARAAAAAASAGKASRVAEKDSLHLAIAIGQEHRLGRWWRIKDVRNEVRVLDLGN
ncbi:pre-rRNA processing protein [Geranomyces variabilis]|uniref:Pre-rRNA processing protein n=1 Tax=Geranomyces variabilis TaxID=109894 RepID=A0AAD5XUJ6_9FUNG|nr:pre-rRNA processing protein [Geranomyces variabilis]